MAKHASPSFEDSLPTDEPIGAGERSAIELWTNLFMGSQNVPLHWLLGSQRSWAALHKEMWESWCARFGGGVPIDG